MLSAEPAWASGRRRSPSLAVATVIGWAGMRGVVTLAAALSLPADIESRDLLLICAFAVILVTVLVQGTTLGPSIGFLGLGGAASGARDEHHRAVLAAVEAGRAEVLHLDAAGEIHDRVLRTLEWELDLQQLVSESHDE